ncbi:MAG: hypothetical protein KDD51_12370 [Bdellovibrionales bacterium]|nr:hypothetical protein [Bdellovibrionales bacterium]
MRYLLLIIVVLGGFWLLSQNPSQSNEEEQTVQIQTAKKEVLPSVLRDPVPLAEKTEDQAPVESEVEAVDEEAFVAQLQERFRFIAELPGAHELAWDIRDALLDNPNAFDMSNITVGPEHLLRPDYLNYMIPDPALREKWVALMDIVMDSLPSE